MPKIVKAKTDTAVRKLKHPHPNSGRQPVTYNVGGVPGLLLQVTSSGAKSWILRATIGGKVRHMGLGSYTDVPLATQTITDSTGKTVTIIGARDKAKAARALIKAGRDPIEERKAEKAALAAEEAKQTTFRDASEEYYGMVKAPALRSKKGRRTWLRKMELHAFPVIGDLSVDDIERVHVLKVLKPTWPRPSTVTLRSQIESVIDWAVVEGYRDPGDNPAAWRTLKHELSAPGKAHEVSHRAALPYQDAPAFVAELRKKASELGIITAAALEFVVLTAARSGEVRKATWDEIDIDEALWTIPGERMKSGRIHRVPLSESAIKLLKSLPLDRTGLIFQVPKGRGRKKAGVRTLHDYEVAALNLDRRVKQDGRGGWKLTDEADGKKITVHGFRSTFKDWARSRASYPDEVSELALAHVSSDATRAAYARDQLLPKRAKLMAEWASFLEKHPSKAASVTEIGKARRR